MSSLYRNRFLLSLDGLIAYSRRGAEEYRKAGVAGDRIFAATNAAVRRPKVAPPIRPDQITGKPVILFVGRLQRRKRVDLLMRACAKLPERLQPQVWVVGDGPARSDLERMAQVIYPQAEFPGAKRGDDLEFYFSQADLFVLPGTGGLAVQEAMAHGLPVIVAEGDGTQDDLVRAENGWQIRPGDAESLEESIREALSDLGKLRKKGLESFRIVREEANVERMVQVFVTALNSMS
jgi:glycosyltransferase involved in cell wall biosynthesis